MVSINENSKVKVFLMFKYHPNLESLKNKTKTFIGKYFQNKIQITTEYKCKK